MTDRPIDPPPDNPTPPTDPELTSYTATGGGPYVPTGAQPPEPLPPGLLHDLIEVFHRYGHQIDGADALPALIGILRGGGAERRSSTTLLFNRLVQTYTRSPLTPFDSGERHGLAVALSIITGRGHAGLLTDAERAAEGTWQ